MFNNSGYTMMNDSTRVYIKIDKVDFGFQQQQNKSTYMACIGSRNSFKEHGAKFSADEKAPKHVWNYIVNSVPRASFVLGLFKCHFLSSHKEVGQIELKLKGFKPNTITTKEYTLPTNTSGFAPKITLSIHITDNGAQPFQLYSNTNNAFTNTLLD